MVNLGRGRFFLSAAIIPVANLMPSHSIAAVLAPTPRELILQHLATIRQEMVRVPTITGNNVLHHAVGEICRIGVQKLATPRQADVAKYWRDDPATVPLSVLPVAAMRQTLGVWKAQSLSSTRN